MTKEEKRQIKQFEARVRQLILQYHTLQDENTRLGQTIKQQEAQIQQLKQTVDTCRKDYDTLKTAKIIEVSDNDITAARKKISRLVREINKCIAIMQTQADNNDTED